MMGWLYSNFYDAGCLSLAMSFNLKFKRLYFCYFCFVVIYWKMYLLNGIDISKGRVKHILTHSDISLN